MALASPQTAARTAPAVAPAVASRPVRLQRKCACGAATDKDGICEECKAEAMQRKLSIGASNDPLEHEADRIAEQVLAGPLTSRPRGAAVSVQRFSGASSGSLAATPASVAKTLAGAGRPLEPALRHDMEQRFGHDFSNVRIHADSTAARSAREVSARAYTMGQQIAFGAGQFAPGSQDGRRLLAHELTHVVQQTGDVIRRAPDAKALKEFNERADKLRQHPVYVKLKASDKTLVAEILTIIRQRDDALAQLTQLEVLFNTQEGKPAEREAEVETEIATANEKTVEREKKPAANLHKDDEAKVSADKSRHFRKTKGRDGTLFQIDTSDVSNIALIVQVRLVAKTKSQGNTDAIANIKKLQDSIEKRIATWGYSLDLQFVEKSGPEVFTIDVNTGKWADAGNIAGGDTTFAHELHHLLGLEEDRYDYTHHATNAAMPIPTRIYWFRREFTKTVENNPESIMNSGSKSPLDDDICMVAGKKTKADIDACVKERTDARAKIVDPAIAKAATWAKKASERVAIDAFLTSGMEPARVAKMMFENGRFPVDKVRNRVAAAYAKLASLKSSDLRPVGALIDGCEDNAAITPETTLPIGLCPEFFRLSLTDKSRILLSGGFHLAGIGGAGLDSPCAGNDCKTSCGGNESANTWAKFTQCFAEL
jgi:hypothetical protein